MRVLLLGAAGMLGRDLAVSAPAGVEVVACTRAELDITDGAAVERRLRETKPAVVLNAAAYTAVDKAEAERDLAFRVNGEAVGALGRLVARTRLLVVHYSTDYVFDGTATRPYREEDPVNPVNAYGASKLAGEQALATSGARYLLLRTSWLFGVHGRSFPRTMWNRARTAQPTQVVNDQQGRPTYTVDLALATWLLVRCGATGIMHVANTGETTWYEMARVVFNRSGVPALLSPCTTQHYPTPARRPRFSVLDTTQAETLLNQPLPDWRSAIERFLINLRGEVDR